MKQMMTKTIRFQLMKLIPGAVCLLFAALLYVPVKLWCDNGLEGFGRFLIVLLWAGISLFGYYLSVHYYGYLYQTAFLASAAEYAVNQALPSNYRDFIQQFVKGQFKKAADFQYLYRLIGNAVTDFYVKKSWTDRITLPYLIYSFVCINFYKKKAGKYKTMADAVVLFAKNQEKLFSDSKKTSLIALGTGVIALLIFWLIFSVIPVLGIVSSLIFAALVTGALKYAFLDSWVLTRQLLTCGQLEQMGAEQSYEDFSNRSRAFRKLYHKVRREQSSLDVRPTEFDFRSLKFCGECGALVAPETEGEEQNEIIEQKAEETVENGAEKVEEILGEAGQASEKEQGMEEDQAGSSGESSDLEEGSEAGTEGSTDFEENNGNSGEINQAVVENSGKAAEKVVFCGECGSAIFQGEAFCGECGAQAEWTEEKQKFCGECGAKLEVGEKFCGECGAKAE